MRVRKRNGSFEPVDINKIVRAISRCCYRPAECRSSCGSRRKRSADCMTVRRRKELDKLSIQTAASLIFEEPEYSRLAARLLNQYIEKEVRNQEIHSFSQSIAFGVKEGLIDDRVANFVSANSRKLERRDRPDAKRTFRIFRPAHSLRSLSFKNPHDRAMSSNRRSSSGCASRADWPNRRHEAIDLYRPVLVAGIRAIDPDAVQFGHTARATLVVLSARFAAGQSRKHLQEIFRCRHAFEVFAAASGSPITAFARRVR